MKFTVIRSRFLELLSNVQSVVPGKPNLQIISNVMIEARDESTIILTTTDLDVSVRAILTTDVKVDEGGATTLPVKKLVDILRMAPEGEVQFDIDADDVARVITSAAKYRVIGLPVRDFPVLKEPDEAAKCFTIDKGIFREMLRKTSYATGTDETRRTMTGVCLQFNEGKLTMVATDGKRLSLVEQEVEFPPENGCEMILPQKTVAGLSRLLNSDGAMQIYSHSGQIVCDCGAFRFYSKLIEGLYPKYQTVIPTSCEERVSILREELAASIQRVSIMVNDKANWVRLSFADGALSLSATNTEAGEASDVLPIKYSGVALSATYNPSFLMDCLRNLDGEEVVFEVGSANSPMVIKSPGVPFLAVVMPLRIPV